MSDDCIDLVDSESSGEEFAPPNRSLLRKVNQKRKGGNKRELASDSDDWASACSESDSSDEDFTPDITMSSRRTSRRVRPRTRMKGEHDNDSVDMESTLAASKNTNSLRSRIRQVLQSDTNVKHQEVPLPTNQRKAKLLVPEVPSHTNQRNAKPPVSATTVTARLKSLQAATQKRSFPLSKIPPHQVISTGRTIKPMKAWKGHWPALREFMQNTIDHLGLMDGKTGRRHSAIDLRVTKDEHGGTLGSFHFTCGNENICTIDAFPDELVITQWYTFPIASRALDTGVPDTTKGMASSNQAGGFGDGFKTAAVALLANPKEFESLKWYFDAGGEKITWTFEGLTRQSIGTFAKCQVLQVRIDRDGNTGVVDTKENVDNSVPRKKARRLEAPHGKDCTMKQVIQVKGIGKSFINQAVPRLVVFWEVNDDAILHTTGNGGDFIACAQDLPSLFQGTLGGDLKPESGIYVRGIWVRKPKIANTVSCFFGSRLQVNGRDRNDVDEDELIEAVVHVFKKCGNLPYLKQLLEPLRGQKTCDQDLAGPGRVRSTRGNSDSWLLQSPRFLNRVIELQKDFILHNVLGVPRGAIFVSSKTTKSNDPFIKWAADFLKSHGAPLVPIERGANKHLFEEVNEAELTERCVRILKGTLREGGAKMLHSAFKKLLTFMGLGRAKVFFSTDIATAFCYEHNIFIPEANLTRELVVRVLNVCHSYLEGASDDSYSCLMQAIFETLPAGSTRLLEISDLTKVVAHAKTVQKDTRNFMANLSSSNVNSNVKSSSKKEPAPDSCDVEDLTELVEKESVQGGKGRKNDRKNGESGDPTTVADLMQQIRRANQKGKGGKSRQGQSEDLPPIIPQSEFESDNAGQDTCLRPSSLLQDVQVDDSLGGGSILCDADTASAIQNGTWNMSFGSDVLALRQHLKVANDLIRDSIPSLAQLLQRVKSGFDADNVEYEGFCNGTHIIINLNAFRPKLRYTSNRPRSLVHDFVVIVTHELAHFLEPTAGHGPLWRDTHMKMVIEVMQHLEAVKR